MVPQTPLVVNPLNSIPQFGFKEGTSCNNAGLLITESQMEAKDVGQALYTIYMDMSKVFHMVDDNGLLWSLYMIKVLHHSV